MFFTSGKVVSLGECFSLAMFVTSDPEALVRTMNLHGSSILCMNLSLCTISWGDWISISIVECPYHVKGTRSGPLKSLFVHPPISSRHAECFGWVHRFSFQCLE